MKWKTYNYTLQITATPWFRSKFWTWNKPIRSSDTFGTIETNIVNSRIPLYSWYHKQEAIYLISKRLPPQLKEMYQKTRTPSQFKQTKTQPYPNDLGFLKYSLRFASYLTDTSLWLSIKTYRTLSIPNAEAEVREGPVEVTMECGRACFIFRVPCYSVTNNYFDMFSGLGIIEYMLGINNVCTFEYDEIRAVLEYTRQ